MKQDTTLCRGEVMIEAVKRGGCTWRLSGESQRKLVGLGAELTLVCWGTSGQQRWGGVDGFGKVEEGMRC